VLPESPSARNVKIPLKKDLGFQCSGVLETSTPAVFPFFSDKPSFRFCCTHAHTQQAYVVSLHIHTRGHRMHSAASRPHDYIQLTRYDCFNECILKESMRFSLWSGTYAKYFFHKAELNAASNELRRITSRRWARWMRICRTHRHPFHAAQISSVHRIYRMLGFYFKESLKQKAELKAHF